MILQTTLPSKKPNNAVRVAYSTVKKKNNNSSGRLSHIIFKAGHPWVRREKGKEGIRTKVRLF